MKSRPRSPHERRGGTDDRRGGTSGRRRDVPHPLLRVDRAPPDPERLHGQRRYDGDVLGRLAFIGVAQSAGFKLREIKDLLGGIDDGDPLSSRIRSLSVRKLDEVEALLERTWAMKGWLEVAQRCGCATPEECALFPSIGDEPFSLALLHVAGRDCRRP